MEITQDQKLYADLVTKAWEDAEFKKELVANPVAAIEKFTGKKLNLPAGKTIVVRDQTDESVMHINIPAAQKSVVDAQLSDEQLEAVSGGAVWPPIGQFPWLPGPCFPIPTLPVSTI